MLVDVLVVVLDVRLVGVVGSVVVVVGEVLAACSSAIADRNMSLRSLAGVVGEEPERGC